MVSVVAVMLDSFVVHGLYHRHGVGLHDVNGHFHKVHMGNFHDALHWDRVVNGNLNHPLDGHFDDLLDGVRHGPVNLDVLDFHYWHGNFPHDRDLDGVGVGYGDLDGVGLGHGVGLRYLVSHFTVDFIGLIADAVLGGGSMIAGESVDFIDDGSFGVRDSSTKTTTASN